MQYDIFFAISQTPVAGYTPSESEMFRSFFAQVEAADRQGYGVAWVAEAHLSTEVQKRNRRPVIPHWQGEVGLNANLPMLATHVFRRTRRIECGSAVMNILTMGGPIAAAERVATMLALHGLDPAESRRLHVGFAAGRFEFMNEACGIVPRSPLEQLAWPVIKGLVFREAAEIFIRLLRGDTLCSDDVRQPVLRREMFWPTVLCGACGHRAETPRAAAGRCKACGSEAVSIEEAAWEAVCAAAGEAGDVVPVPRRWAFEHIRIVPQAWRRELLQLVAGSHEAVVQDEVNQWAPVQVFNLSITQPAVIEETHQRMALRYHPDGGPWKRSYMPRTTFVFVNGDPGLTPTQQRARAQREAEDALGAYWTALEGTIAPNRVENAAQNALIGNPEDVARQARERFHPDDRLMLWFDFFDHDCDRVIRRQADFIERVAPLLA
jgi:alkanesulfonate monooxygenase SsuD/methylene tetrahydromethanopterin reductase-like flavin-dependent oxidoreductase (luciferase family)